MSRVWCLNNYPLEKMLRLADQGESPRQHAWGVDAIAAAGHEVTMAPFHEPSERNRLQRLSGLTRNKLGQLDQEWPAWRAKPDLVYSADAWSAQGLALARMPTVAVLHHPVSSNGPSRAVCRRLRAALCLSDPVAESARAAGVTDVRAVSWGPDLDSPLYQSAEPPGQPDAEQLGVVSAGKSNRDLATLVAALSATGDQATVYDLASTIGSAPHQVELIRPGGRDTDPVTGDGYLPRRAIADLAAAAVVAICIGDTGRLTGLTEVNDALALGKPMIVTRTRFLPIDIDAIGCGISVDPGDVEGWVAALRQLANPATRFEMGRAGREFAEKSWNYKVFCDQLVSVLPAA